MSFKSIPQEIWQRVFKNDLVKASAVCKLWNKVAAEIIGDTFGILLPASKFKQLDNDLNTYPTMGLNITKLTVLSGNVPTDPDTLERIIRQCPNLLVLELWKDHEQDRLSNPYDYLKMLNTSGLLLPKIQTICINFLKSCSPATNRLYLSVNFRYRKTITSLQIIGLLTLEKYGGFKRYISQISEFVLLGDHGQK